MKQELFNYALEAGGSHYPSINPKMQEAFANLILNRVIKICEEHPAWTGRMISEEIKKEFKL
jgi:hypothetical protein